MRKWLVVFNLWLLGCISKPGDLVFKPDRKKATNENRVISGAASLSFGSLQKYILRPKCMQCHSGSDALPSNDPIDFDTYETTTESRFIPLFIKGKPEKSRLYQSVESGKMPIEGRLHNKEIEFIWDWIKACAPNNETDDTPSECKDSDDDDFDF